MFNTLRSVYTSPKEFNRCDTNFEISSASSRNDVTSLKSVFKAAKITCQFLCKKISNSVMESSNSDSENECFESAEESLEEDENDVNTEPNNSLQKPGIELPECLPHCNTVNPVHQLNEDISGNSLSYRRRPERAKRLHSKPLNRSTSKAPDEPIFKADKIVSDVFLQDITTNLSKNINRSLTTLQQTSSNVKELIFSTIPVSSHSNNEGFSYDDKQSFFTSADTVIDNKHYESTGNMGDNLAKKENSNQVKMPTEEITFSLAEGESVNVEGRILSSTGTDNLEKKLNKMHKCTSDIVVLNNTMKKEEQNQDDLDSACLNSGDIYEGSTIDGEHKTDTLTDEIEVSVGFNEKSISTKNETPEMSKQNDKEGILINEDNSEETVKCLQENLGNNNEISDEPSINEKELAEKENTQMEKFISPSVADNWCTVQANIISPSVSNETNENENVVTSAEDSISDMSIVKLETDSTCNLKELKTVLKNIIKEEECDLKNVNENFKEDFEEGEIIFKGKMVDNETSKEGWEDFDFTDSDDSFKQDNTDLKEESKSMDKDQVNTEQVMPSDKKSDNKPECKSTDYNLTKGNFKIGLTMPSTHVISDKSVVENQLDKVRHLVKENEKHITNEIIEIKPVSHDSWDWDAWGEEADSNGEGLTIETKMSEPEKPKETPKDQLDAIKWSGWDNFGQKSEEKPRNWALGSWGVDMLLNKATTVTQGISNVLEAGLGAPDPETLARMEKMERENLADEADESEDGKKPSEVSKKNSLTNVNLFPVSGITSLVAGVTSKIVEHSKIQEIGSKVINGGLDTLETFGKKTMEVLQEGDPGLKNKRALLLGDQKPVLSQVLREAREKADKELKKVEERELAKKCHFETLFDDFQGMVHLEALEMLSTQYELKLEQLRCGMSSEEQEDFNAILEEVEQLCSLDEYDMDLKSSSKLDFKIKLQMAVEPLKNEISIQKIIQIHEGVSSWLQMTETRPSFNVINQKLVSTLAELAAATVQQFHKSGELLSVKECRKTVEEVDALLRLTNVLCAEINILCEKFMLFSKERSKEVNNEKMNSLSENVTTVMTNSTSYIRQAFNLLIPVLQFGAAVY